MRFSPQHHYEVTPGDMLTDAIWYHEMGLVAYLLQDFETTTDCWQAAAALYEQLGYPEEAILLNENMATLSRTRFQ